MLVRSNPNLKTILRIAHIRKSPDQFIKEALVFSLFVSVGFGIIFFFFFSKLEINLLWLIPAVPLLYVLSYIYILETPKGYIKKREREIDKEVLFAGRYLLVKMESGYPLFNSLIDGSKSYGVCSKYFKEIVDEIETGTSIEKALENAREYNASAKFKRILWQIIAALKTGADVTDSLKNTLKEITNEQIIEIKAYGKKLNSLSMFYMVIACVLPSLGITLFLIVLSFMQFEVGTMQLFAVLFGLGIVQLFFIIMLRAVRPMVDL